MELPLGTPYQEHLKTTEVDMLKGINDLMQKAFTGYIVVTIQGIDGMEEGAILFRNGIIVGAGYEFMKSGTTIDGTDAFEIVLNAFKAKAGIIDIYSLSLQHMDLVIAFHEKMLIKAKIDPKTLQKLYPKEFSDRFAKAVIKQQEEQSKYDVFKKIGLPEMVSER
ncbi:MAG: DUF2226 domain-containing protein [Candidatus Diapherotrites archaeon]|nr:DUF2226 domain-containing protein [Candidatus Diapherotrites archaeon]